MADVTGPISTLPGAIHEMPEGTMCDFHPERPSVVRIQGETDSFGCEMHDLCDECAKEDREERRQPNIGDCDWCDRKDVSLTNTRDYEEGMCGRVYGVCQPCLKKYHDDIEQEAARYDTGWDED